MLGQQFRQLVATHRTALIYLAISIFGLASSVILALVWVYSAAPPAKWLSLIADSLAFLGGAMCLYTIRITYGAAAPSAAAIEDDGRTSVALQGLVSEMSRLLTEERGRVTMLQEVCAAGLRDARALGARVENLAEAALDAESRLSGCVDQTLQQVRGIRPEIGEMLRHGVADATRSLHAEKGPLQQLQAVATDAALQLTAMTETTAGLRRNVSALEAAGREIAVASATVVSRVAAAAGQVDTAAASLPDAVAGIREASDDLARRLAAATDGLHAEAEALSANGAEMRRSDEASRLGRQEMESAAAKLVSHVVDAVAHIDAVLAEIPPAVTAVTEAAANATQMIAETSRAVAAGSAEGPGSTMAGMEAFASVWPDALARVKTISSRLDEMRSRPDGATETSGRQAAGATTMPDFAKAPFGDSDPAARASARSADHNSNLIALASLAKRDPAVAAMTGTEAPAAASWKA